MNPSASGKRMKRPDKEDLKDRLHGVLSEIAMHKIDERVKTNEKLKRITSLDVSQIDTDTAHKKKPTIDEIIAEMEAEIERLG